MALVRLCIEYIFLIRWSHEKRLINRPRKRSMGPPSGSSNGLGSPEKAMGPPAHANGSPVAGSPIPPKLPYTHSGVYHGASD